MAVPGPRAALGAVLAARPAPWRACNSSSEAAAPLPAAANSACAAAQAAKGAPTALCAPASGARPGPIVPAGLSGTGAAAVRPGITLRELLAL